MTTQVTGQTPAIAAPANTSPGSINPIPGNPKIYRLDGNPRKIKIKMGLYGRSGVGKTRLATTIGKHFKTFLISSERSNSTIVSHPEFAAIRNNLDIMDIESWDDVKSAFDFIVGNQDRYEWVIVDSLTDINKRVIDDVQTSSKEETLSMRQWGQVGSRMEKLIRYMRDLRTNVLFVCLSSGEKNELTGEICQYPSLTGRLKEEMPAYLDINGYMYTAESKTEPGKVDRWITFVNTPKAVAKDRFDKLNYEPSDMSSILKKLGLID